MLVLYVKRLYTPGMVEASGHNQDKSGARAKREYQPTPESVRRGQLLLRWLEQHDYDQAQFSRDSGISKMTVGLYVKGDLDIANMHQRTVEKLLTAMHVSDTWAWEYFEIPAARRVYWRTFREAPMGHGEEPPQGLVATLELDAPLGGEGFTAPAGALVSYDSGNVLHGLLLVRLPGRYVVARQDALPTAGEVLGEFLGTTPVPAGRAAPR